MASLSCSPRIIPENVRGCKQWEIWQWQVYLRAPRFGQGRLRPNRHAKDRQTEVVTISAIGTNIQALTMAPVLVVATSARRRLANGWTNT